MSSEHTFGEWLRQRRRVLDLTQVELAQQVGCSAVTLRKLEAEARRPSKQIAERLAEVLQVPPGERPAFLRFARGDPFAAPVTTAERAGTNAVPGLPSGTLTLLFTDLEGSTSLLQRAGSGYAVLLSEMRAILRAAFARWNGREIDTQGDAFFVAFTRASNAVQAAVEGQRMLAEHTWPPGVAIRVRMGLHTGEPELSPTGYTGLDVHRAARIGAAAHGGQVLLSQSTRELLLNSDLSEGVSLRDLGEHRLKDLRRPRRLFQLVVAGLPADFPPLKTLDVLRNNLPIQLTRFIGREYDLAAVKGLLASARLLTLTGVGGTGKTRLALQVAADCLEQYPDGVCLVELAALADPSLVPSVVATTLGLREEASRPVRETLLDYLRDKGLLLVLDNCEHLIEACAGLAHTILRACEQVNVLATSREGLGIAGETLYPVPSLSLPDASNSQESAAAAVAVSDAGRLFIERAQAVTPHFVVTAENAAAIAQICRRLDGIPLALELAAARVQALSPDQIAARLDDRFRLLTGGSRTALERQQTLRATMEWSYQLLSAAERVLLQRLSVFSGGWILEAAEHVCSGDGLDVYDVADLLARLAGKSLVVMASEAAVEPRYHMLETIRQYAREKLLGTGEGESLRARHLAFYLQLAEAVETRMKTAERLVRHKQATAELDNFRAALEWSLAEPDPTRAEAALRLASALGRFWLLCGYFAEGRGWLEKGLVALATTQAEPNSVYAKALYVLGWLASFQGDWSRAIAILEESITLSRKAQQADPRYLSGALNVLAGAIWATNIALAGALTAESVTICRTLVPAATWDLARALFWDGSIACFAGDDAMARPRAEESRALFLQAGDIWETASPTSTLGHIAVRQGDYVEARTYYTETLRLYRESGDTWGVAACLSALGNVDRCLGEYEALSGHAQESLRLWRDMGHRGGVAGNLYYLGIAATYQGDYERAGELLLEGLVEEREALTATVAAGHAPDAGDHYFVALELAGLSLVAQAKGQSARAARLLQAAESVKAIAATTNQLNDAGSVADRIEYERLASAGSGRLPDQASAATLSHGQSMTWEQAIELGLKFEAEA